MRRSVALLACMGVLLFCTGAAYEQPENQVATDSVIIYAVLQPSVQINQINIESSGSDCRLMIAGKSNCDVSIDVRDNSQEQSSNKNKTYIVYYQDEGYFLTSIQEQIPQNPSRNLKIIITPLI